MGRKCFICSVNKDKDKDKDKARKVIDVIEKQFFEVVYENKEELVEVYVIPDEHSTNIDVFYSVMNALILEVTG